MFIAGIILVILGLIFFLQNAGFIPYDTWNNIWPIMVVLIGVGLMFARRGYYRMDNWDRGVEDGWSRRAGHRMGGTESRAYGHDSNESKEQMHDRMEEEM